MTPHATVIRDFLDSAYFARAYAVLAFSVAFGSNLIENLMGPVTLGTIVTGVVIVGGGILFVRRRELSWLRIVPSSIFALALWMIFSLVWTTDVLWTLGGVAAAFGYGFMAIVIASTRDSLQTVRALGDVLRALLVLSLLIELLSGVFLDIAIPAFGIQGNLTVGGPLQGIFETRNLLGLVSVIAIVTFAIELRTHSVSQRLGRVSLGLAVFFTAFSLSPTAAILVIAVALASGALAIVRSVPQERRTAIQLTLAGVVVVGISVGLIFRHQIIRFLGAGTDFSTRADLWNMLLDYSAYRPWTGWGFFGPWRDDEYPFLLINHFTQESHSSALNAFFDILLQLGIIGLVIFILAAGIALTRSWVVATERRSILYAWTPLVLITLLVNSMLESTLLTGVGFMLFVLCATRAGQSRSWRETVDAGRPQGTKGN